jgi:hypothetical protein
MKLCGSGNVHLKHLHSSILHIIKVLQLFQDAVFVGFIVFKAIFILIQVLILFRQNTEISSIA